MVFDDRGADYEQMCLHLFAYQFGHLSFMQLVEQFERLLNIQVVDKAELMDERVPTLEGEDE